MTDSITVIIPTHNRAALLKRAIASVLEQTHPPLEILVIDDHSTEDLNMSSYPSVVRFLSSNVRGVSAARNTGIKAARGSYIAFLDSDDEWLPEKLEKQLAHFQQNPNSVLVHCNERWVRNGKAVPQLAKHKKSGGRIFDKCVDLCLIGPSCTMVRAVLFKELGTFDESFPVCEDFDLWLRVSAQHPIGFLRDELVTKHGGHDDQLSMQFHSMDLWRLRALAKHIDNPRLSELEHQSLKKSMREKAQILLSGFQKRNATEHMAEAQSYLEMAQNTPHSSN